MADPEPAARVGEDLKRWAGPVTTNHRVGLTVRLDQPQANGGWLLSVEATGVDKHPMPVEHALVVASGTKALTGHSDLLLGVVAARDEALLADVLAVRSRTGAILGPFEAWLAHRSLATLDVRLAREEANALALASMLASRDDVSGVRYPGRDGDPAHAVAATQMTRFGTVMCFDVAGGAERAQRFLGACALVTESTSFGGVHTTAERRARWGDAVPEGFIRLSAGIEDPDDLLEDVARALDATG